MKKGKGNRTQMRSWTRYGKNKSRDVEQERGIGRQQAARITETDRKQHSDGERKRDGEQDRGTEK